MTIPNDTGDPELDTSSAGDGNGPIATHFGFESTAADVIAGIDLTGRRAIVTGVASGIGVETARVLAQAGAAVMLAVRRLEAGERVAAEIRAKTGNPSVAAAFLDLADLKSVVAFAQRQDQPLTS